MPIMNTLVIIIGLLALVVVVLVILVVLIMKRLKNLTRGKSGKDLESVIKENNRLIIQAHTMIKTQEDQIKEIKRDAMNTIQNIGVIRFNPFKETGGSQSFAVALTDKNTNGVVISSLDARERVNVFAKPIRHGSSEYTLTEEEKQAIAQSKKIIN